MNKLASKAVKAHFAADALSKPLLPDRKSRTDSWSSCDSSDDSDDSGDEGEKILGPRFFGKDVVQNLGAVLLATGGLAAATVAMVTAPVTMPGIAVFLMGGICAINSPLMAAKQVSLSKHGGVRDTIKDIRKKREVLEESIDFLTKSVDELQEETNALKKIEQDLNVIAVKSRIGVEAILNLVNENEDVLNEMKSNMRKNFVQAMIKACTSRSKYVACAHPFFPGAAAVLRSVLLTFVSHSNATGCRTIR